MKITKFAQSCILIETNGKRILIDPGIISYDESLPVEYWNNIDILLVTHKHADHFNEPAIKEIVKNPKTKLYSSAEVNQTFPEITMNIVKAGDVINDDDLMIKVVKAVHGYLPYLRGDSEIHENVGYIIEAEGKKIYITSDTLCFKNDFKCDVLFVPVSGCGLVMGPFEASLFAKETEASLVVPIHMDNPRFPVDLSELDSKFSDINYKVMTIKESIEV